MEVVEGVSPHLGGTFHVLSMTANEAGLLLIVFGHLWLRCRVRYCDFSCDGLSLVSSKNCMIKADQRG